MIITPSNAKVPNPLSRQDTYLPPGTWDPLSSASGSQPYPITQQYTTVVYRRSTFIRFLRAFGVAALICFLCASFLSMVHHHLRSRPRPEDYPISPDITLDHCISSDDWLIRPYGLFRLNRFTAVTTLDLPLSAEALFLLSRGPMSGSVEIVTSSTHEQDVVTVEINVSYFREDVRNHAQVCRVFRKDGEIGVGIFTRGPFGLLSGLNFATKVILPESSPESPISIKKFETDVVNTAQRVGDLNEKVLFNSLLLKGSNGPIDVESVRAHEGIISTSNAGIRGIFNTSMSMSLITSNGRVEADVGLSTMGATQPKLVLTTSNAPVTSRISLISDFGLGGSFQAEVTSSNGHLDINFPAAPPNSLLKFIGKTSNAQAAVSLNPAYEGSFLLQTSVSNTGLKHVRSVNDPTGRNRTRSLNIDHAGKELISGKVYWDDGTEQDDSKPAGLVSVRSSNAQVELVL